jgi:hypothetical protein
MFQYAAGKRLARDHDLKLLVDDCILVDHSPGRHKVNRHFGLDIFKAEIKHAALSQRRWFNPHGLSVVGKIAYRMRRLALGDQVHYEKSFRFDEKLVSQSSSPPYIAGLWQSYKYFEPIADLIRSDFSFRTVPTPAAMAIVDALNLPETVCLHVRRGDYVSKADSAATLEFIGLEYYHTAVREIRERIGCSPRFFIFSDDIQWCKAELKWLGSQTVFVEEDLAGLKPWQYMQIMSSATYFVISNSTFAWWAAWLAPRAHKVVIAPRAWFKENRLDSTDLCPPQWIRV